MQVIDKVFISKFLLSITNIFPNKFADDFHFLYRICGKKINRYVSFITENASYRQSLYIKVFIIDNKHFSPVHLSMTYFYMEFVEKN